jgi:hypothetical protein
MEPGHTALTAPRAVPGEGARHLLTANVTNYRRPPVVTRFARPSAAYPLTKLTVSEAIDYCC